MPKYRKLRIEQGTGATESNVGLPESGKPEKQNTPIVLKPSEFVPFKNIVSLTDLNNFPIGFIVTSSTGLLNAERVLTAGPGIIITDHGPNNIIEISLTPSAIGAPWIYVDGSAIGQSIKLNFQSHTIDISAHYNSGLSRIDLFFSASPATTFVLSTSAIGNGEILVDVSGSEISHKTIEGKGIINVRTSSNNTLIVSAAQKPIQFSAASLIGHDIIQSISGLETVYKTIVGGGNIEVSSTTSKIIISAASVNIPDVKLSAVGSGIFVITKTSSHEIVQRTFDGRGTIDVYLDGNTIVISAASKEIQLSALSTSGVSLIEQVSANEINARNIKGGLGIQEQITGGVVVLNEYWIHANNSQRFVTDPVARGTNSVAIGHNVIVSGNENFAIGANASIDGRYNIVIMSSANVQGHYNIVLGRHNAFPASANHVIQLGSYITTKGSGNTIVIGYAEAGSYAVHVGFNFNMIPFDADQERNYVFGIRNTISNIHSLVLGSDNFIDFDGNTARSVNVTIGSGNTVIGAGNNFAFGKNVYIASTDNFVIGISSQATYPSSFVLGNHNTAAGEKIFIYGTGISAAKTSSMYFGLDRTALFIRNNGFVGINTENPATELDVEGKGSFKQLIVSADSRYILPVSAGTAGYLLISNGAGNTANWIDPASILSTNNWIHANNGNNFTLAPSVSGNNSVAIGYNVHVLANDAFAVGHSFTLSSDSSFAYGTSGKIHFFINSSGKVGIGTTNPQATLDIRSDNDSIIQFVNLATGTTSTDGTIIGLSSQEFIIDNRENSRISIRLNNRDRFVIDDDEFVFLNGDLASPYDMNYRFVILQGSVVATAGMVPLFTKSGNEIVVPASSVYGFTIDIIGKEEGSDQAAYYEWKGIIRRPSSASAASFIGSPLQNIISESVSAVEWNAVVSAVSAKLRVSVTTGSASNAVTNWVAMVKLLKLKG